jgi:hypothetical protein
VQIMTFDFLNNPQIPPHRTAAMQQIARQLGGAYAGVYPIPLLDDLAQSFGYSESFTEWKNKHPLTGMMSDFWSANVQGRKVAVFDQTNYVPNYLGPRRSDPYTQTFFLIEIKEAAFPLFCLQPVGVPDNFTRHLDFPSHPLLPQKIIIYSRDEAAARPLFTPEVLDLIDKAVPFTLFAAGKYLVIYQIGKVVSPDQIITTLSFLADLADLFLRKI